MRGIINEMLLYRAVFSTNKKNPNLNVTIKNNRNRGGAIILIRRFRTASFDRVSQGHTDRSNNFSTGPDEFTDRFDWIIIGLLKVAYDYLLL